MDGSLISKSFRGKLDLASVTLSSQSLSLINHTDQEDQPLQILLVDEELMMILPCMTKSIMKNVPVNSILNKEEKNGDLLALQWWMRKLEVVVTESIKLKIVSKGVRRVDDLHIDMMVSHESIPVEILRNLKYSHGHLFKKDKIYELVCHEINLPDRILKNKKIGDQAITYKSILSLKGKKPTPSIEIYVKTLTGKTIILVLDPYHTVGHLKQMVQNKEGIPPDQQRIVFSGDYISHLPHV
jgi:hypothetical protein